MYLLSSKYPTKRAFITGAASGLGKALCMELANDGWTIGIADIQADLLMDTKKEIEASGGKAISFALDVADKHAYQQVAKQFLEIAGGIDLLVNNAGIGDGGNFEDYPLEHWEHMVKVNQMSVVYGCYFFIPAFKKQRSGHIVNIASLAAVSCAPQMAPYNMTKAAVVAISETLYGELMNDGINVSCAMPYYFKTNIAQSVRGGDRIKKITEVFIQRSGFEADDIAREILTRAGKGELYILLPKIARKMWLMKRLFPMRFRRTVMEKYFSAVQRIK